MPDGKDKNPYSVARDLAADPTDFTAGGRCSMCGNCCSSILPLGPGDIKRLKAFAEDTGFVPELPDGPNVVYAHCPFLDAPEPGTGARKCLAYDVRPDVCRIFSCANTNYENAAAWAAAYGTDAMPEPMNIWMVFDRTGLRFDNVEIPYSKAPFCRIADEDRNAYEFHVGRPASFILENDEFVPPSLVLGIYGTGLHVFNGAKSAMEFIPFENIKEILSRDCRVEFTEDMEPVKEEPEKEDSEDA